jgi:shikimate kinase
MMGSGKSTVAHRLAARRGARAVDVDEEIVRDTGSTIAELFAQRGEVGFRDVEATTLARLLAVEHPLVLATGGGVVLRSANVAALRARSVVVWLDASVATLAARVGDGTGRPLLQGDPIGRLGSLDAERRPYYAGAAHLVVAVDALDPDGVAEAIQHLLAHYRGIEVAV